MRKTWFIKLLFALGMMVFMAFASAATALWTVTPVKSTPLNASIAKGSAVIVKYLVTNQSNKPRTLMMIPIPSVSQMTGAGYCASRFTLKARGSCTLALQVKGTVRSAPKICQSGSIPMQCYQPAATGLLNTRMAKGEPTLMSIVISPSSPQVIDGRTQRFTAQGIYSDSSKVDLSKKVTWSSSNTAMAQINSEGLASGLDQGSSMIKASLGAMSGSTMLQVMPKVLVSIHVTTNNPSVADGLTSQFTATGTYSDASTQNISTSVSWSSSNSAVASIDNQGLVTGVDPGSSTISATLSGIEGQEVFIVTAPILTSIDITPNTPSIADGQTKQLLATGTYTDGSTQNLTTSVSWSSSNGAVASIDNQGLVTGVDPGSSTISATLSGIEGQEVFTVTAPILTSIDITPNTPSIADGQTQQLLATGTYSDGSTQNLTASVSWSSSNSAVAGIDNQGLVTGVDPGSSTISATLSGIEGQEVFTVTAPILTSIDITPNTPSIADGQTQQMVATGTYTDGSTQNLSTSVSWSSSNSAVAGIDNQGLVTGVDPGSSTISATLSGIEGQEVFIVTAPILASIDITPNTPSIADGQSQPMSATGTYSDGSIQDLTLSVSWSSSNTAVASVNHQGLVTGLDPGSSTISATLSGVTGNEVFTVTAAALVSLEISPLNQSINEVSTQQYTALGNYTDGSVQNKTAQVTWSSSSPAYATISNTGGSQGLASAVAPGSTSISASLSGHSDSTNLTITQATSTISSNNLTLVFMPSGVKQYITINNTSASITATNISATLPPDWSDVAQDASQCTSVPPLGSCQLGFTPGTISHDLISVPISGTNTSGLNATLFIGYPWVTNGNVTAIVRDPVNNILYIGGSFTRLGPNTGGGVPLDTATGTAWSTYPRVNGAVHAVVSDGSSGWYIGGTFTNVGGVSRNRIAHILSNGAVDTSWNPSANATVNALALSGTTLYVGGAFTTIGGQSRSYIAALKVSDGLATTWNPSANSIVNALAISGTTVYVGGYFSSVGGMLRNYIGALSTASNSATTWSPNANGAVHALAINATTVYAGGDFTTIGGQTRNRIAAINISDWQPGTWNPNANNAVYALAINATTVYAGGLFTTIGGQARNRIAALNISDGLSSTWNPNATSGQVSVLVISGTNLYVGGSFSTIGGQSRSCMAVLDTGSNTATSWNTGSCNLDIKALAISGTAIFAGGTFTSLSTEAQTRNNIAALDAKTGKLITGWNPGTNAQVYTLLVNGAKLYVGGNFTTIAGQSRGRVAELNLSDGSATNWNPPVASAIVRTMAISDGILYLGGDFTTMGAQARNRLAALQLSDATLTSWNPNAGGLVLTLAVSGTKVYVGGTFTTIGGQTRNRLAALNISDGFVDTWNPNVNGQVSALVISGSTVYLGGGFSNIGGVGRIYAGAVDIDSGIAAAWNPSADGGVQALFVSGSTIYAAGGFLSIGGQSRSRLGGLNTSGTATSWNPAGAPGTGASALYVSGGTVYVGGTFSFINGQAAYGIGFIPQ